MKAFIIITYIAIIAALCFVGPNLVATLKYKGRAHTVLDNYSQSISYDEAKANIKGFDPSKSYHKMIYVERHVQPKFLYTSTLKIDTISVTYGEDDK